MAKLISLESARRRLGIQHALFRRLVESGQLPTIEIANEIRISLADLNRFVERHRSGTMSTPVDLSLADLQHLGDLLEKIDLLLPDEATAADAAN